MTRSHRPGRRRERSPPGRLRIVAGKWRSRLLPVAAVDDLRPTPARVRETVFNWLATTVVGARCLDLFAGSGALGFEALSRGAASVEFVDASAKAVRALTAACDQLDAVGASVEQRDAFDYLQSAPAAPYDLVFLDPPYADDSLGELCRLLASGGWLAEGARLYFEHPKGDPTPQFPAAWSITHEKAAGQVRYGLIAAVSTPPPDDEEDAARCQ